LGHLLELEIWSGKTTEGGRARGVFSSSIPDVLRFSLSSVGYTSLMAFELQIFTYSLHPFSRLDIDS